MRALVSGVESRTVHTELTAKTAAAAVTELTTTTETSVQELRTSVASGQVETAKLRNDIKAYTIGAKTTSKDVFAQILAKFEKSDAAALAQTQGLNQLRAKSRTFANAAGGDRTPQGVR